MTDTDTDTEIRIAIAEHCGWTRNWQHGQWVICRPDGICDYCDPDPDAKWETHRLPDYPNDLNAMHEAEKTLTQELRVLYCNNLAKVCGTEKDKLFATAPQRAEAFCRTIGKWMTTLN